MNEEENNSFRDLPVLGKIIVVILISIIIIGAFSVVFGGFFFGIAGFFTLFGVYYESIGMLLLYVLYVFLFGYIFEVFAKVFIRLAAMRVQGKFGLFFVRMTIDSFFNWLVLFSVDEFMSSIKISITTEIAAALLLFLAGEAIDSKKRSKNKRQ